MQRSHDDPLDHLRLLLPEGKDLFSIKEVAQIINKSTQFTRDALRSGKILGYALKCRSLNKAQDRSAYLIHRDDIIMYLLKHANHSPSRIPRTHGRTSRQRFQKTTRILPIRHQNKTTRTLPRKRSRRKLITVERSKLPGS